MLLKSDGFASNLSAPADDHTLRSYCAHNGAAYDDYNIPVSVSTFTDYALDFQRRFVPDLDPREVTSLASVNGGFVLQLDQDETIYARRVVLAVGISHFEYVPDILHRNGCQFVSHSSAHRNLERFRDADVTIIGAGASAIANSGDWGDSKLDGFSTRARNASKEPPCVNCKAFAVSGKLSENVYPLT